MKSPGYMAVTADGVIHVIKCIPIEITLRKTNTCHTELPVTFRNTSLYMTPNVYLPNTTHSETVMHYCDVPVKKFKILNNQ